MVTSRTVEAVLLQQTEDGPTVVRRFSRQRSLAQQNRAGLPTHTPDGESEGSSDDFTIQFGDTPGGGSEMFLNSEFAVDAKDDRTGVAAPTAFDFELADILAECRDAGYADPVVAFAVGSADAVQLELRVPSEGKKKRPDRSKLVKLLKQQHDGPVDEERAAFIAMTSSDDGEWRFLAIIPRAQDAITTTLQALKSRKDQRMPAVRLMDTETSLYLGLARSALKMHRELPEINSSDDEEAPPKRQPSPNEPRMSLVVRAGVEDTIVMFLRDDAPMFVERLRSLTSLDAPETICSRILLQQDEYGVGEVHHVFVLSADRERELVGSFKMFFPDACVERLGDHVPAPPAGFSSEGAGTTFVPASAVGARMLGSNRYEGAFEPVNLILRKYTRRAPKLPFTWHIAAMTVLMFASLFFFGIRYASQQHDIAEYEEKLREYPPSLADTDIRELQSRIDSLRGTSQRYLRALDVLDTLMVGSDRWSRALEKTSNGTASVSGIWVDSWRPVGKQQVRLNGNATSRDRVVRLAERMDGHIEALTFSEIREWPVYSFVIDITLPDQLPEAAEYLRERAREIESARVVDHQDRQSADERTSQTPVSRTSLSTSR